MWDWHSWCCSLPTTRQKQPNQSPLVTEPAQNDAVRPNCISFSAAAARMLTSWLNRRRWRYLLLILCSPFLVPLLCAMCPIICAVELCFLMARRRRRKALDGGGDSWSRFGDCSVDGGGGVDEGLLQRYLEDQLMLVAAPPYGCGDEHENLEDEDGVDVESSEIAKPPSQ